MKLIYTVFFLIGISAIAQDYKFGQVSTAILEETQDEVFKDVPAKVVYRRILFDYGEELEIHERVKIYNEDGFEFSNWEIPFTNIKYLQAYTYNLEDGVIKKTHVQKSSIYKEEVQGDYTITKVSFPKVKKGSVIEIKYRIERVSAREIPIQYVLPIKNFRLVIQGVRPWMDFKQNPNYKLDLVEEEADNEKLKIFTGVDIPSSKEEPYLNNPSNYQGKIFIKNKKEKSDDEIWGEIAGNFIRARYFGEQLRVKPYFKKDITPLIQDKRDTLGTAKIVYQYLQQNIEYNGRYGTGTYDIEQRYKDKKANKGTINLMLVSILRDLGYKANPMAVACKHRGELLFPEEQMFNVTIGVLQIGNAYYLLDASEKHLKFGLIPLDLMNDYGLIVLEDGRSISYPTRDAAPSVSNTIVTTKLNLEDNSAFGSARVQITNHLAWQYKEVLETVDDESFSMKEILEETSPLLSIHEFEDKKSEDSEEAVQITYDFTYKDAVEGIGDNLYVSPFLFLGSVKNKFDDDDREFPLDLDNPEKEVFNVTFHIPEGYNVESLPEGKHIVLEDNLGSLTFNASQQGLLIQLRLSVQINYSYIPARYYSALKELYNVYTQISNSKIVLKKLS